MRGALLMAVVLAGATAVVAAPASAPDKPGLDLPLEGAATNPDWRTRPSGDQISLAYPKFAALLSIPGSARMKCTAEPDGSVDQCAVTSESPAQLGFGAAALRLAPYFQMNPATIDGHPTRSSVDIPIRFQMARSLGAGAEPPLASADPANLALAREIFQLIGAGESGRRTWSRWLEQMVAQAVSSGDPPPSPELMDALQSSIGDLTDQLIERRAHDLAATASVADLTAMRDFFKSQAGRLWMGTWIHAETKAYEEADGMTLIRTVRARLCAKVSCGP